MSNIICFLLGFGICYFLACFVIFFENQYNMSQPRLWFARPWGIFMLIICFIPTLLIQMFKLLVNGIPEEQYNLIQKVFPDIKRKRLFNNIYFCQNPNARRLSKRYYFIRVKNSQDN